MNKNGDRRLIHITVYVLLIVIASPWFMLAIINVYGELIFQGVTLDAPNKFAILSFVKLFAPLTILGLLVAFPMCLFLLLKGANFARWNILIWWGILAFWIIASTNGLSPSFFESRAVYNIIEMLIFGALTIIPTVWLVQNLRKTN